MKHHGLILLLALLGTLSRLAVATGELNPLLKFVPDDTLFFSGNTHLVPVSNYPLMSLSPSFDRPLSQAERQSLGKELNFFYELFVDLEYSLRQGHKVLQNHYGLTSEIAAVIYSQGLAPIIKLTLENELGLLKVLDKAEDKSGFRHSVEHFHNQAYRRYVINEQLQFIVNVQKQADGKQIATLALISHSLGDESKKLIFGLQPPKSSIADSGQLNAIIHEHHYLPISVSFVDFQQLVKTLFQVNNNPWKELLGESTDFFTRLRASKCQTDVLALMQDVPRIVAGYKNYQRQGQSMAMDFEVLLELKNHNLKKQLGQLRGFIPAHVRNDSEQHILAFALGTNLSQLSPLWFYMTQSFKEHSFSCAVLIEMQQQIAQINPAMLALITGVVDGIHGVSFAVQDLQMTPPEATAGTEENARIANMNLSMLMSLTAENPQKVWQLLSAFVPRLASQNPPVLPLRQPQRLDVPELNALGLDVFVAIKGQHLVLYSGEKAADISRQLAHESIVSNGLFQESVNYSKLTTTVQGLREHMHSNRQLELPAEACNYLDESLEFLSRLSGVVSFQSDFVSKGWLNTMSADIKLAPVPAPRFQLPGNYETLNVQDGCRLVKDGREQILADGSGLYQKYSEDGQCFIFETRYRWSQQPGGVKLQYISERSRPEGACGNEFDNWSLPEPEYINDECQLRAAPQGSFACLFQWNDELTKTVYKRIQGAQP